MDIYERIDAVGSDRELDAFVNKYVYGVEPVKQAHWIIPGSLIPTDYDAPLFSADIRLAIDAEDQLFEDGKAVGYINVLSDLVLSEAGLSVQNDWLHLYLIAHASAHQRCRAMKELLQRVGNV